MRMSAALYRMIANRRSAQQKVADFSANNA